MSKISIDIGTSTIKIIEYKNNKLFKKEIYSEKRPIMALDEFIKKNKIKDIEYIVTTGIGADKIKKYKSISIKTVSEFNAIAKGGLYLSEKNKA